jgi:ribosomal protein S18 acetylase RimI-like enzyme
MSPNQRPSPSISLRAGNCTERRNGDSWHRRQGVPKGPDGASTFERTQDRLACRVTAAVTHRKAPPIGASATSPGQDSRASGGALKIRSLRAGDAESLGDLFEDLRDDPESVHFHPHPFTRDEAHRISVGTPRRRDLYFAAFLDARLVGYGMLRGWDEGYEVPSFGVAVRTGHRGAGIGRRLLRHAISMARRRGAQRMMLKVHPANGNARRLYESEGFRFDPIPLDNEQLKGIRIL